MRINLTPGQRGKLNAVISALSELGLTPRQAYTLALADECIEAANEAQSEDAEMFANDPSTGAPEPFEEYLANQFDEERIRDCAHDCWQSMMKEAKSWLLFDDPLADRPDPDVQDRTPADPKAIASAVVDWIYSKAVDERDIELERVLIEQGVMNVGEAITEIVASDERHAICVVLECGTSLMLEGLDGEVSAF